jgi:hypothetical protein
MFDQLHLGQQESIEKIRKDLSSGVVQGNASTANNSSVVSSKKLSVKSPVIVKKSKEEVSNLEHMKPYLAQPLALEPMCLICTQEMTCLNPVFQPS